MTALLMILNPDISTHIPINSKDYFYENIYKELFPFYFRLLYSFLYLYDIEEFVLHIRNDEIL